MVLIIQAWVFIGSQCESSHFTLTRIDVASGREGGVKSTLVACYGRGSTFCLNRFLNDGLLTPKWSKIRGRTLYCLHSSRYVFFFSGSSFYFSPNQFLREVLSPKAKNLRTKKVVHLYRSPRHFFVATPLY